jgi:ankyrin repeat protein
LLQQQQQQQQMKDIGFYFRASGSSSANNTQDEGIALREACRKDMNLEDFENLLTSFLARSVGSINDVDCDGNTALMIATQEEKYDYVMLILDTGEADVNIRNNLGDTALIIASRLGNEAITSSILEANMLSYGTKRRRIELGTKEEEDVRKAYKQAHNNAIIQSLIETHYLHLSF